MLMNILESGKFRVAIGSENVFTCSYNIISDEIDTIIKRRYRWTNIVFI